MKNLELLDTEISLNKLIDDIITNPCEVIITRNGLPIARLTPCQIDSTIKHYPLRGKPVTIASDFDEPMPELWEAFEQ